MTPLHFFYSTVFFPLHLICKSNAAVANYLNTEILHWHRKEQKLVIFWRRALSKEQRIMWVDLSTYIHRQTLITTVALILHILRSRIKHDSHFSNMFLKWICSRFPSVQFKHSLRVHQLTLSQSICIGFLWAEFISICLLVFHRYCFICAHRLHMSAHLSSLQPLISMVQ